MKQKKYFIIGMIILILCSIYVIVANIEKYPRINVYAAKNYQKVETGLVASIHEQKVINEIDEIISNASKDMGISDSISPDYIMEMQNSAFQKESIRLWLGKKGQKVRITNIADEYTSYIIFEEEADKLRDILQLEKRNVSLPLLDREIISSLEQLIESKPDLIVHGKLIDEGSVIEVPIGVVKRSKDFIKVEERKVAVVKTIYGNKEIKEINFQQLVSNFKFNKGDEIFLILMRDKNYKNVYASMDLENGIFMIDKEKKIVPLSDNPAISKYKGYFYENFEAEIINILSLKTNLY